MPTPENETDYYALLGVDPGADPVTIRKAVVGEQRRWAARQNAPDLATRQEAERFGQLLTDVRGVLLDPGQRALYDVQRVEAMPTLTYVLGSSPASHWDWSRRIGGVVVVLAVVLFLTTRASTGTAPEFGTRVQAPTLAAVPLPVVVASTAAPVPGVLVASSASPESASHSPPEPPAVGSQLFVTDTDGQGVFLSATPNRGDRLTAWPEGTQLDIVGDDVTGDGLLWASVRTSDGQLGFVPRQYVSASPPRRVSPTPPPAPSTTRPPIVVRALPDEVPVTLSGTPLSTSIIPPPTQPFALAGGRYSISWSVAGRQPCDFVITIADPVTPALKRTTLSNHVQNRLDGQPAQGQTSITLNSGKYRLEAYSDTCTWSLTLHAGT